MHPNLEGDGRTARPAGIAAAPSGYRRRRRGDGDAHRRLARSTFDLFAIVKQIVDAKAQFRSLAEPWADTGTSTGRLMIAVLGGWRTWSATSSGRARRKDAAGRRRAGSIWPTAEAHPAAAARSTAAAGRGRYVEGTGEKLQRGAGDVSRLAR